MSKKFSFVRIFAFILPIIALALFFFAMPIALSSAQDIPINDWTIELTYGAKPSVTPRRTSSGTYYTIGNFVANIDGVLEDILDDSGIVVLAPRTELYSVQSVNVLRTCNEAGEVVDEDEETNRYIGGKVYFSIVGQQKDVFFDEPFVKTYGESAAPIVWKSAEEETESTGEELGEGGGEESGESTASVLTVTMTSDALDAKAAVGDEYSIDVVSVYLGEDDVTPYYDVTPKITGETGRATYRVAPAAVEFTVPEDAAVIFNDYLLSDGESVLTAEANGANGETVTGYFRLKEAASVLTIGEDYAVELYKISVSDAEGAPLGESAALNYAPSADPATVRAKIGEVVLTQNDALTAAKYVHFSSDADNMFRYVYLDDAVASYGKDIVFKDVEVFPDIALTLTCTLSIDGLKTGDPIPCGTYPLTLFSCEGGITVTFEDMYITVAPRVFTYNGERSEQYGVATHAYTHTETVGKSAFTFDLVATLREEVDGTAVYAEVDSLNPFDVTDVVSEEDPNVHLSCEEARVRIVKCTDGVAFAAVDDLTSVYYDIEAHYVPCRVERNGAELTDGTITYSNRTVNGTNYVSGLPTNVGQYVIKATFSSEHYEVPNDEGTANEAEYALEIVKRPVIAAYILSGDGTKRYGETYEITSSNAQLKAIYPYDEETGETDTSVNYLRALTDVKSNIAGFGITSAGMAVGAVAGAYDFEYNLGSNYYEICGIFMYKNAIASENKIEHFVVKKAGQAPAPTLALSVNNRTITAKRTDGTGFEAELSENAAFASPRTATSDAKNEVQFKSLKYGKRYYVRIRIVDGDNYETAAGAWSEVKSVATSLSAPTIALTTVTDAEATFTETERVANAVSYVLQHKVGDKEWADGLVVTDLAPDSDVTILFRAKSADVSGETTTLTVRTKRAPVKEGDVSIDYDRQTGELSVTSAVEIEMCLLSKDGVLLRDWTTENVLSEVERDCEYILQVRNAADETSAVTKIEFNTFKAKEPFTLGGFLSDWFLIIVSVAVIAALIAVSVSFAKLVKRIDLSAKGGKNEK